MLETYMKVHRKGYTRGEIVSGIVLSQMMTSCGFLNLGATIPPMILPKQRFTASSHISLELIIAFTIANTTVAGGSLHSIRCSWQHQYKLRMAV